MPTQNVNLPPQLKEFVEANVRQGRFGNASEVVRAGLRLLEHEQTVQKLKIKRLREASRAGIEDVASGRFTEFPAAGIPGHLKKIARGALRKTPATR